MKIIAAAIRKEGIIYAAKRHDLVFREWNPKKNQIDLKGGEQGFLTDAGTFVDRKTAAQIAFEAGQTKILHKVLMSEDLIREDPTYYATNPSNSTSGHTERSER